MIRNARVALLVTLVVVSACSSPSNDARVVPAVPDRASFPAVADLLEHRCGTLDCHGSVYRNLRLYGHEGLRLSPNDRPLAQRQTTAAEYDEDLISIVALEPEITSAVVAEGGAHPERLTLVRKARGTEAHKGGTLMNEGDPQDVCLTSWLAGHVDPAQCRSARASVP